MNRVDSCKQAARRFDQPTHPPPTRFTRAECFRWRGRRAPRGVMRTHRLRPPETFPPGTAPRWWESH